MTAKPIARHVSGTPERAERQLDDLVHQARNATQQLKSMAHESRLAILFHLYGGTKTVSELEELLNLRQPAVSQQLARLRADNMVATRREGKQVYYSIANDEARMIVDLLCRIYCPEGYMVPKAH